MFTESKNSYTVAPTVSVLHTRRTTGGLFSKKVHKTNDNTPSMPLNDAHLGGFFFYTPAHE
jgi:hypothetical protein